MKTQFLKPMAFGLLILTGASGLLMSGCSQDPGSNATTFTQVYEASFSTGCFNCHSPGGPANTTLDFTNADTAYNTLINIQVQSPANPSQCANVKRVVPGSASTSYLMGMLFQQDESENFGGVTGCEPPPSHNDNFNFTAAERSSIISWIDSGAAR